MNDEQRKEIRQQFWDEDYFDGLPNRGELLKHFINEYGKAIERQQQSQIEELKADNFTLAQTVSELTTIRGSSTLVPDDKLKEMRERLAHLEKMIVWYQDITMTGTNSQDYENGFWDAVNFVKQHQLGTEYGHN